MLPVSIGITDAYVAVGLPDWFNKHLATMDCALAAKLKATQA